MWHKQEANSTKQAASEVVSLSWNHSWHCNWFISARSFWFLAACCHIIKVFRKPFSVLLSITLWPSLGTTNGEQSQYRYPHRLTSEVGIRWEICRGNYMESIEFLSENVSGLHRLVVRGVITGLTHSSTSESRPRRFFERFSLLPLHFLINSKMYYLISSCIS